MAASVSALRDDTAKASIRRAVTCSNTTDTQRDVRQQDSRISVFGHPFSLEIT
jgi:hypothetical protein